MYFHAADERGPCFAFAGAKRALCAYGGYIVAATAERADDGDVVSGVDADGDATADAVQVYDLKNKFVAHNLGVGARVAQLVPTADGVVIVTEDGAAVRLVEKDAWTKLECLFRKNLYPTAIALAHAQGVSEADVAEIHRRYADHLHSRGDYRNAVDEYAETIGHLAPSAVLKRFLGVQQVDHLAAYLAALHRRRDRVVVHKEHTALLLSCYCKLGDAQAIDEFVTEEAKYLAAAPPAAAAAPRRRRRRAAAAMGGGNARRARRATLRAHRAGAGGLRAARRQLGGGGDPRAIRRRVPAASPQARAAARPLGGGAVLDGR